jgi:hypothetical protein
MEIRGNLDIHELIQIRGGNPNNEYILTSSDAEGNSLWRQHWFLTQTYWDEWENSYNESEATQNKAINTLSAKYAKLEKEVDSLDDNYVTSGVVNVETQELIFTDKNGGNFTVTNSAALFTDTDTYVMSGEYNPEMGEVTFLTNIDTSFKVTGFAKDLTDTFTDSASLDGNTLTFIRNNKQTYDVDLSSLNSEELWSEKPTGNNIYRDIGNVGIGTDSPQTKLHIKSSGEILRLDSTSLEGRNYLSYYDSGNKRKGYLGYGGSSSPEHLSFVNDELGGNIQFYAKGATEIDSHNKIISANFDDVDINGNVKILNNHTLTINDYTFPAEKGDNGQVLKTDGDGNVTWEDDTNSDTDTSIWTEGIELSDGRMGTTDKYYAFYNKGQVGIGTDSPQTKLHIEGPNYDESSIRFLNDANGNDDYWMIGSRSFSGDIDGFEIGRNFGTTGGDSTGGKLYITKDGNVGIGTDYQPERKLHIKDSEGIIRLETTQTNGNNYFEYHDDAGIKGKIGYIDTKNDHLEIINDSNNGEIIFKTSSNIANLLIEDDGVGIGGAKPNASTILNVFGATQIQGNDKDTNSVLHLYRNVDGRLQNPTGNVFHNVDESEYNIDLNYAIGNNAPNNWTHKDINISILDDIKLSIKGDSGNIIIPYSVKIEGGVPDSGKVLTSDVDGLASWEYVNFGLDEEFIDTKVAQDHTLKENYFTKVQTLEGGSTDTNNFILPALHSKSKGKEVVVKHVGGGNRVIITPPSGKQIDGEYNSVFLNNGDSLTFYCDGVDWYIKSHYENKFGDLSGWSLGGGGGGSTPDTEIYFLNYNSGSRTYHDIFPNGSSEPYSGEKVLTFGRSAQKLKVQTKARNNGFYDNTGSGWEIYEIIKNSDTPSINLRDASGNSVNSGSDGDVIEQITIPTGSGGILRFRSGSRLGQLRLTVTGR